MDVGIPDVTAGKFVDVSWPSPRVGRAIVEPAAIAIGGAKLPPAFAVVAPSIRVRVVNSVLSPCRGLSRSRLPGGVVVLGLVEGLKGHASA